MAITPGMVGAAINLVFTEKLIDAQKEASDRLIPFAERATAKAKEQFSAQFTSLRAFDNQVYGYVGSLPNYSIDANTIYRGQRTGHIAAANLVKGSVFGMSRYNCGDREAAINAGLSAGLVRGGEVAANAGNFEDTLQAAYAQLKWTSLSRSASPLTGGTSKAFGDIGRSLERQSELLESAAEKSVASLVYLGTSAFLNRRQGRADSSPAGDTSTPLPDANRRIRAQDL